ncbi:MAG: SRPBCC family protein [Ignavibacteria bacterium]|nr:SRPBCC family protein [Ignavibacteria bacterium]
MKFTCEVEINKPIKTVVEIFDNPDNMDKWMEGLISFEPLSGTPGQPGAKSKLKFKMGKREVEMIETITVRNLPDEFTGTYEANGVYNISKNKFIPIEPDKTKYINEQEFEFKGFMKLIGLLMPGAFKKQSMKYLIDFKNFVENGKTVKKS